MAWAEVEDAAGTDVPETAAAEPFALIPAFFEDDGVGFGDVEGFAVHLGLRDVPFFGEAGGDGVIGEERGDVAGSAVGAVGGEDAGGEGELP